MWGQQRVSDTCVHTVFACAPDDVESRPLSARVIVGQEFVRIATE